MWTLFHSGKKVRAVYLTINTFVMHSLGGEKEQATRF